MVKKKSTTTHCGCGKGTKATVGTVSLVLGLILWFSYLSLEQVFAIILVLVGLKKLFKLCH
ncbi:hypothetical protein CMO90_00625 [Candidatus Woesearchaeota archaeon]|jgi:hypothetical protein|nr:hypothetical protein [Candidatus Woesearchaeota archaeon]|tara:strand:+ start:1074 stop:1256 length:183 start_codon:yes stop_codon:yes gene_type:complete